MDLAYFCCTLLLLFLVGFGSSDLAADIQDCGDKLVGLAGCRPYVGGDAKVPSIDCCSGLKVVLEQSKKCLCILIKDRDDPDLGFKMNATLAVHLPSACHAPANITQCVDLLHLSPKSPEAKVFEGFQGSSKTNSSTPVSKGGVDKGSSSSTIAQDKSYGLGKRLLVAEVVTIILPFVFMSHFFILI